MTGHRPVREGVYETSGGAGNYRGNLGGTVAVQPGLYRRISWGAVIGGALMVVAVQLLLSMLGIGIGMTTIDPAQGAAGTPDASTFSLSAVIWWAVSYLVALVIGGYVAARLAGAWEKTDGVLHGLLTWALGPGGQFLAGDHRHRQRDRRRLQRGRERGFRHLEYGRRNGAAACRSDRAVGGSGAAAGSGTAPSRRSDQSEP